MHLLLIILNLMPLFKIYNVYELFICFFRFHTLPRSFYFANVLLVKIDFFFGFYFGEIFIYLVSHVPLFIRFFTCFANMILNAFI